MKIAFTHSCRTCFMQNSDIFKQLVMLQNLKRQIFFNSITDLKYVLVSFYALELIAEKKVKYRQ